MIRRLTSLVLALVLVTTALVLVGPSLKPQAAWAATTTGPLHTTGTDGVIYNASNEPVRLVGYNWTGMEGGGRNDFQKAADVCGYKWRTPADRLSGLTLTYDDFYQNLRNWGYNVIRLPIEWNNLEPIAPTWDAQAGRYVHTWNVNYLNDLRSMITKAKAAGIMVILDMQQDFWSPALHNITNWDGTQGYCEGYGMPRWMYPSIDAKPATTQNTDFYNGMNWFFRNIHDPMATVTHATPWDLYGDVWKMLSYEFSAASGFPDYQAVVGADLFNEPWWSYVGGNPPAGQSVAQAAGSRLLAFYTALAPSITANSPTWLLIFQDTGGRYNTANPSVRESPWLPSKPAAAGNWVYSVHDYDFTYGTFSDGVSTHDDYGVNLMNAVLANAQAWHVPLYIGEFTNFSLRGDARNLTAADLLQTRQFVDWAKQHGVSWTFWAYLNPYLPMTMMYYGNNQPITVVKDALDSGLDPPSGTNQPPVASFTSSVNNLQVTFNGSASTDPDGTVTSWSWNFGDGQTGTGANTSVTYAAAGTYTVTLTVTDDRGGTASTSSQVTVSAAPSGLYASDTFSRTVTGGWGAAEVGGAWSWSGGASTDFWVAGGAGQMSVAAGATRSAMLNAVQQNAVEITTALSFDRAQTGGGTYISVVGRRVTAGNDYHLKVRVQANGVVTLQLARLVNGTETVIQNGPIVAGVSWTQGEKLRVRFRVNGATPTALAARIWEDGAPEPTAWNLTASDSTASLQSGGSLGLSTYLSSTATGSPITIAVDDFAAGPLPGTPLPNVPPVASFTSSCTGLTCNFDGSTSSDSDGTIAGYSWNFGDGQTRTGPTTPHTFAAAGTYPVALTVTDNQGAAASSTASVTVTTPPAALATDTFTRTVSGGWGTADVGGAWSSASPASLSVAGGAGNITVGTPGTGPSVFLTGVSSTSTDLTLAARTDKPATGSGIYLSVAVRRVSGVGDYRAKIRLQSNAQVSLQLVSVTPSGTETALSPAVTIAGLTYDPTVGIRVRVQATGANPTTLRARLWSGDANAAEPSTWQATATDSNPGLQVPGGLGLTSYMSSSATNAPVVTRFDDLSAVPVP